MKRTLSILCLALGAVAFGQDPVVGPQIRVGNDPQSNSSDETSASAVTSDGSEFVGGWNDYRTDGTIKSGFAVSSDFGATWANVVVRPPVANQTTVEGDPMAAHDPRTGTLWSGAMAFGGNGGIYIARKNVGANTFQPSTMARTNGGVDKGWMAAGIIPGNPASTRLYITYNEGVIRSDNLGATFTSPLSLGSGIGFLPRVGPAGQLYVTYWDFSNGVKFRRSLDGGLTFSAPVSAATRMDVWSTEFNNPRFPGTYRVPPIHTMAVDPNDGTLYIVYFDTTNTISGNKNVDLYMVKSTNQGTSWSSPARLPFRALGTIGDQFFPWLEVDARGRLQIVFFDSQNTAQNDGNVPGFLDQYYAYSDNAGTSWTKFRLTPNSFNSSLDGRGGGTSFMGDYNGLAFGGRFVYPLYLSTALSQADAYTNVIYDPIVRLSAFSVFRGVLVGGALPALDKVDASEVTVRKGIVANALEAPNQVIFDATSPLLVPSRLDAYVVARTSTPNLEQRIEAFNVSTSTWDLIDTRPASTSLQTTQVQIPNQAQYITGAGAVRMRVAHKAIGPVNNNAWTVSFDEAVFLAYR